MLGLNKHKRCCLVGLPLLHAGFLKMLSNPLIPKTSAFINFV
jgi:hypothetical protein